MSNVDSVKKLLEKSSKIVEYLKSEEFQNEIKENMDKLSSKIVLDCHNIINLPGVYHI